MKWARARARGEKPEQESEQDTLALFVNRSQIVRGSLDFANKRTFRLEILVRFQSNEPAGEWDQGLINEYLRARLALIAKAVLQNDHKDWQITVEVTSKYNGRG